MNLTIQQVAKLTGLAMPTLYTYSSRQKIGKKVGNQKVFSQADVQKLLKSSKKFTVKKTSKPPGKKTKKRATKTEPIRLSVARPKAIKSKPGPVAAKSTKLSFWRRFFGSRSYKKR
jgi:predicted DNA-binding transcriptional regulator AlpA